MRHINWLITLGTLLIFLSISFYVVQYLIFRNIAHLFDIMLLNLAFLPLNILFSTLIINHLLKNREKRTIFHKIFVVIGTFYSELGNDLLTTLSQFDPNLEKIREILTINNDWNEISFKNVKKFLNNYDFVILIEKQQDLNDIKQLLESKRKFVISLLNSPILFENDLFTDLIFTIIHILNQLSVKESLNKMLGPKYEHLASDFEKAYSILVKKWLLYLEHIKKYSPYLYSLAIEDNPFSKSN